MKVKMDDQAFGILINSVSELLMNYQNKYNKLLPRGTNRANIINSGNNLHKNSFLSLFVLYLQHE